MPAKKIILSLTLTALVACCCPALSLAAGTGPYAVATAYVRTAAELDEAVQDRDTIRIILQDDIVIDAPIDMPENTIVDILGDGHKITSTLAQPIFHAQVKNAGISLRDVRYEGGPICDLEEGQFYLSGETRIKAWGTLARARYINLSGDVELTYTEEQRPPLPLFVLTAPGEKDFHGQGFLLDPDCSVYVDNLTMMPLLHVESPDADVLLAVRSLLDYVGEGACFSGEPLGELFLGFDATLLADVTTPGPAPLVAVAGRLELDHNARLQLTATEAEDAVPLLQTAEDCQIQIEDSAQITPPLPAR